jgi:hypothetical protein
MSGPIEVVKQTCRKVCLDEGLCVTVEPTTFIYTGGEESGVVVGLIAYPRFPQSNEAIWKRAFNLARTMLDDACQHSVLIMDHDNAEWLSKRDA